MQLTIDQLFKVANENLASKQAVLKKVLALNKKMVMNRLNIIQLDNYFKNYLSDCRMVRFIVIDGGLVKKVKFFKLP